MKPKRQQRRQAPPGEQVFVIKRVTEPSPFVVLSRHDEERKAVEHSQYFHLCEQYQVPFIVVEPRRKYAAVSFDMISIPRPLTDEERQRVVALFSEYSTEPDSSPDNEWFHMRREVPAEIAEILALRLWQVIVK